MAKKLKYTIDVDDGWNEIVLDLPMGLSIQERKLHRSFLNYTINGGYVYDTNNSATVKIGTAPDSWPVRAAARRARDHWLAMHKEIFTNNPQLKPKWHDFKMMLTKEQVSGENKYFPTYRVPEDIFDEDLVHQSMGITWSLYTTEDGQGFNIQGASITDKDEFTTHLLGRHVFDAQNSQYTSVGALRSWVDSRPRPTEQYGVNSTQLELITADPFNMLFNDGDADNEIIANFTQADPSDSNAEGDNYSPYDLQEPNGAIMEVAAAKCSSAAPVSYFTGFTALLGQVFLKIYSDGDGTVDLIFDIEPKGAQI